MVDYLVAVCDSCGHTVHISTEHQGRRAKCPRCDGIIKIPGSETSVRLRSDRELTREARAKAGKTGPETDHERPAARSSRHATGKYKKVVPKPPSSKSLPLILTLVATGVVVVVIAIVLLKGGSTEHESKAAGKSAQPPAPPPPPPPDPRAGDRRAVEERVSDFVRAFNTNNLNEVASFYTADIDTVRKAYGVLPSLDSEIKYEKPEIKSIDFQDPNVLVKISVRRVIRNKETGSADAKDGVERVLIWTKVSEVYKIANPPNF